MRILVVGGSGFVGQLIAETLAERHSLVIFDPRPPARPAGVDHLAGDVTDYAVLRRSMDGIDAVVFLAMGPSAGWGEAGTVAAHFDVGTKGLYLALRAAAEAGVSRVVYTSSMSVYREPDAGHRFPDETAAPDSTTFYGLVKRFGEEICQAFATDHPMSVVALRLCHPTPDEAFRHDDPDRPAIATSATDTARAFLAALDYEGGGYQAVAISGDHSQRTVSLAKAAALLGWSPTRRS